MTTIQKTLIFLPVESTVRELDYKINLARLFCKEGIDVILGNASFIRDELKYKNYRAIFLEKGVNPDPDYYALLSNKGIYLYDLGDEGAVECVYSIHYQPEVDALKFMRKIFLWGNYQKENLIKNNPDATLSEKYKVVGNPSLDLCTPKYNEFHKGLNPKKSPASYILVNTNFGAYQSHDLQTQLKSCNLISPLSVQMMKEGFEQEEKEFNIFQQWLEHLIQFFPDEVFYIRPHPSELLKNYEAIFGKYKNVFISKERNVRQVIVSAKLVLHKDCSTAMESYLMDIPSISLGGSDLSKNYLQWPLSFSAPPKDLEDAKKLIEEILKKGKFNPDLKSKIDTKAKKALDDYFYNLGNSSRDIVNLIIQDSQKLMTREESYKINDSRPPIQKLKVFIRKFLPLHYKVPVAARETMIPIKKKEILLKLHLMEKCNPLGLKYDVIKIFPNTFQIKAI